MSVRATIRINLDTCSRTGLCYLEHAELIAENEDGYPEFLPGTEGREFSDDEAERIIECCPTGSLRIELAAPDDA